MIEAAGSVTPNCLPRSLYNIGDTIDQPRGARCGIANIVKLSRKAVEVVDGVVNRASGNLGRRGFPMGGDNEDSARTLRQTIGQLLKKGARWCIG
jgi:hypothetical protein